MRRLPYIPARDSRHRTAVLALYRALVRSASQIPLPPDVLARAAAPVSSSPASAPGPGPVVQVVRRRFAKNRPYDSLRLVYASMAAGYRFLTLFAKARDPASAEHAQVVDHVRARLESSAASRAARAAAPSANPSPASGPLRTKEPLIFNTASPGQSPRYTSSVLPRPRSVLDDGDKTSRRVPSLCSTSYGQPFLRMRKPQPRALSKMVGLKDRFFQKKVYKVVEINEDLVPEALLEDEWDALVADQIARELGPRAATAHDDRHRGHEATHVWTLLLARLWSEFQIEKTWQDWTARGTALNQLVEEERALAEHESGAPRPARQQPRADHRASGQGASGQDIRPNVGEWPFAPLPFFECLKRAPTKYHTGADDGKDPFLSPTWATLVEAQDTRLKSWLKACGADHVPAPSRPTGPNHGARARGSSEHLIEQPSGVSGIEPGRW
ncbi:ubiquitin-conjugating enzyme [Hirsutella rhossiliensis]|uniref:Ubiquitin-conjugating enzyme n=1 Tax=Hirsutella rhossiliensis TaxID=111463 RepID=A0A9P8MNM4_9HYPO|nr:ubiquitin-conjugating enzyme [Hirsutella rhossiliensis]KAH0958577.1 ubiquitin-conjugating enzyme [Hirsutella rhossiliensis]